MLGPTIGPILEGILAQHPGYVYIFVFLLALSTALVVPLTMFFPETCRKNVGDGSIPPQKWNKCYENVRTERAARQRGEQVRYEERDELARTRRLTFPNPFGTILLLLQRECGYALLYSSLLCCSFYATLSLIPTQSGKIYHSNALQIGLCYNPFGVGSLLAAFSRGRLIDANFRRHAKGLGISIEGTRQTDLTIFQ